MGILYLLFSLLTDKKKTKGLFSRHTRYGSTKSQRKMKGKKEVHRGGIVEASPNVQEPKSNKNASGEAKNRRLDDFLSDAYSSVLDNIQDDPNSAKQAPFSHDEFGSHKEIDPTSLKVYTFVGYLDPVHIRSTSDLHESLIEQLPEFRYCKMSRLNDGFFAFKFPAEDQETLVLEHGQLFINNQPIILKRWSPSIDLVPSRFVSTIPIWVRFNNLNWAYWNQVCLSKISSIIGVPLFMDRSTATMTRLDYARVCIEVSTNVLDLPDTVHMLRNGTIIPVPVEYEWKPLQCLICFSIYHDSGACTWVGVGELVLTAERLQLLQQANGTQGIPFKSYDEDDVETISVSSGPPFVESSIGDDTLQERMSFLGQNP